MASDDSSVLGENASLRKQLEELQQKREQDVLVYEQQIERERNAGKGHSDMVEEKTAELNSIRGKMSKLTKQLDEEVSRRDIAQTEAVALQSKVQDLTEGQVVSSAPAARGKGISFAGQKGDEQSKKTDQITGTKLMRVVASYMEHKDLQSCLLRNTGINDMSFSTLMSMLPECPSLQTLDLSQNLLTMDSCSEVCSLITSLPHLSFVSLADNLFSLRSIGYFMTAMMERQNTKKYASIDLLDLQGNEGLMAAAAAPPTQEALVKQVYTALGPTTLVSRGPELIVHVMRALWRFLHDTGHPQVRNANTDEIGFQSMDKSTIKKMSSALQKMLLLEAEGGDADKFQSVTADAVFVTLSGEATERDIPQNAGYPPAAKKDAVQLPRIESSTAMSAGQADRRSLPQDSRLAASNQVELRDPFSDLKAAFEPPKEKLKTFNLKQIVTRNGTVLMNMLERLLESTEIDATDVETEQTLLEYACTTGNNGLAKLCYRRGANLSARTKKGDTAFNIVARSKRYDIMEFLHKYGVKVNTADAEGKTALHVASMNNDVDGVCRLLEWGADVNIRDNRKRTPLHVCTAGGHYDVTMLLLEVGAELNAQDEKGYTPTAWAEALNHFALMDRLVLLGGKGHGLSQKSSGVMLSKSGKGLGDINVSPQMAKSSSLGRIGKIKVEGLPEPSRASLPAAKSH